MKEPVSPEDKLIQFTFVLTFGQNFRAQSIPSVEGLRISTLPSMDDGPFGLTEHQLADLTGGSQQSVKWPGSGSTHSTPRRWLSVRKPWMPSSGEEGGPCSNERVQVFRDLVTSEAQTQWETSRWIGEAAAADQPTSCSESTSESDGHGRWVLTKPISPEGQVSKMSALHTVIQVLL